MSDTTLLPILTKAADYLKSKGVPSPRLDAELLLAHVLKLKRLDLYLQFDRPLTEAELDAYRVVMRRRGAREPLQHIEGATAFRELSLISDRRALIPRPETELLVDAFKKALLARAIAAPRVLDVGTGSGYAAAVLDELASSVVSIERIPALAARARRALELTGHHRVELRVGDGSLGVPDRAPFDAIAVAAATDRVPPALLDQLVVGGRMVLPRGSRRGQRLVRIVKTPDGPVETASLACRFVPLVEG